MRRRLTEEEREIWARIRRSVRPSRPGPEVETGAGEKPPLEPSEAAFPKPVPASPRAKVRPRPLVGLDARERRRLARGAADVDARIDLHGMSQERAFVALLAFLQGAQARGYRTVLVITGKGRVGEGGRGILRSAVPEWLSRPDMRGLVLGIEEAARRHGGGGALYVRLRRRGHPA